MNKFSNKLVLALTLVLGTALVAGCGGGDSGGDSQAEAEKPATPTDLSVSAMFKYIGDLIAGTSETSEPANVNELTLAVDDGTEPTPLN